MKGGAALARGRGEVLSRVAAGLSSMPAEWLTLSASGVYDLLTSEVIEASAEAAAGDRTLMVRAGASHHEPRFDPGTIWAWFQTAPIDEARLGGSVRLSDDVELGGALRGRHAELGEPWGEDYDAGVEGWARARIERIDAGLSGFAWSGSLGPVAGVSFSF